MPTVHREGRYRFSFFSNERNEPPHVHVNAAEDQAKFWLTPIELESSYGFNGSELNTIERIIRTNLAKLRGAWHERFPEG